MRMGEDMTRRQLKRGDKIVVASHNPGKVWEIKQLLAPYGLDAVSAGDLGLPEPEETEDSFVGNAKLKALAAAEGAGLPALADDSGLEVDVLDGAPGIFSARWAGPEKDFASAMAKVREEVAKKDGWKGRGPKANFICALCLAWPDGEIQVFEGKVFGRLVREPKGGNGFGYDPMFVPDGETITFGEMEPEDKHEMSHRAAAFAMFEDACLDHIELVDEGLDDREIEDDEDNGLEALQAAVANLSQRDELAVFVANLRRDFDENAQSWENVTLPDFLEAMQAWIEDSDFLDEPRWRSMAKILLAASRYE